MRPVPGYEGRYSASDNGMIFSHVSHRYLSAKAHSNGYVAVVLTDGMGGSRDYLVHRLVCAAFHGAPEKDRVFVNHIDADKSNNSADNLEWCSRAENMRHAKRLGLLDNQRASVSAANRRRAKPVIGTFADGSTVAFGSVSEARKNGFSKVSDVLLGNRKTSGGAIWRYA